MSSLVRKPAFAALAALGALAVAADAQLVPPPASDQKPASPVQQASPDTPQGQAATIKVNVELVNILYNVRAKKGGALIPNLEKNNFTVFEDGKQQTIQRFSRETDLPLTLGLLIDISASQTRLIDIERDAASAFFSDVIRSKDEAFLISFGKDTELLQDYTNSPRLLTAGLRDLRGDGITPMLGGGPVNQGPVPTMGDPKGTLLYDAVYLASNEKLKGEVGRKALILITDGEDQGSSYKIRDAIEMAQKADAIIYSIYYVDRAFYGGGIGGFYSGGGGESALRKMSEETGGHVFTVDKKHPLNEVFKEIQDELRNQYSIGYESTNPNRDGTFRHIDIKADNSDYKVQARNGYYATPNDAQ